MRYLDLFISVTNIFACFVLGVPCQVLTTSRDTITCKTGAVDVENEGKEFHPGEGDLANVEF